MAQAANGFSEFLGVPAGVCPGERKDGLYGFAAQLAGQNSEG
jgi:hypothetical protein